MRPPILALDSLLDGQWEDWQSPPDSQGFLTRALAFFACSLGLLTFSSLLSRLSSICRAEPGKLFLLADSFLVPCPAPSGFSPSLVVTVFLHLFAKFSEQ